MTKRPEFMKEFEWEVVRLVETSGRTGKEVAEDLGASLSTLTRWLFRNRAAMMDEPGRGDMNEDMAAELKRLRRENEILRQERDILKKATAFFAKEGSRCSFVSSIRRRRNSPYLVFSGTRICFMAF